MLFRSETDTEEIPLLLSRDLARLVVVGGAASPVLLLGGLQAVSPRLHGAYALAVVWAELPGLLVVPVRLHCC